MANLPTTFISASAAPYSLSLWSAAALLSKVHCSWKWYKWGRTHTDKDNVLGLTIGYTLDFVLPKSALLQMPTIPFFVGSRVLDLFQQEDLLSSAYKRWKESIWCTIPVNPKIEIKQSSSPFISYHTKLRWMTTFKTAVIRTQRVALATFKLGVELFKMVMTIMDVIDIMSLDPEKIQVLARQSLREVGVHAPRCLKMMVDNKHAFLKRLKNEESIFHYGLKSVGGDPKEMVKTTNVIFNELDKGLDLYKKASSTVGDEAVTILKEGISDIARLIISEELIRTYFYDPTQERPKSGKLNETKKRLIPFAQNSIKDRKSKELSIKVVKKGLEARPSNKYKPLPNVYTSKRNSLIFSRSPTKLIA